MRLNGFQGGQVRFLAGSLSYAYNLAIEPLRVILMPYTES